MKIFRKFCECLKINAKFREGRTIFRAFNLWNFYVKYKTFIQKLQENVKKYYPIVSGTSFQPVISFTSSPFGVSSLFQHTQHTLCPNPLILVTDLTCNEQTRSQKVWVICHMYVHTEYTCPNVIPFYYTCIRSLSLGATFQYVFFSLVAQSLCSLFVACYDAWPTLP